MTHDHPLVEFVLPFYGESHYLHEAVRSIQAQRRTDWRTTIVDDCSSYGELDSWVASLEDPRITVVHNERNLGLRDNFSRCLTLASSEYVVFMGGDDRLLPTYLDTVHDVIASTHATVVQPGVRVIDRDGRRCLPVADRIKSWTRPAAGTHRGEPVVTSLLRGNWCYFPSLCWHRASIVPIGFRDYGIVLDLALLVDVLSAGGTLVVDDQPGFEYRRHADSVSSIGAGSASRFDEERDYFHLIARELDASGWHRASRAGRARMTSRAHAISLMPRVLGTADLAVAGRLARHAFAS